MVAKALFSSATAEWATPRDLLKELAEEYGPFDLDAAATPENAVAPVFYTKEDDALSRAWEGRRVWCNPPYGRNIGRWVDKAAIEAWWNGSVVVMLLPARVDTKWWFKWIWSEVDNRPQQGVTVRFIKGRLKFGGAKNSAPFPSVVVVFDFRAG